jgi:hypothetical protein
MTACVPINRIPRENIGAQQRLTNVVGINQEVDIGVIAMKDVVQNLPYRAQLENRF